MKLNKAQRALMDTMLIYYGKTVIKQLPESKEKIRLQELWRECWTATYNNEE